ncbi:hypothetical protein IQ22_03226 [Pseudomonas duriflava]|uniref:Uncharacterized protein n=1 Tax=Pseudomonas duriflava TaxID=459528 RepID=A0A562Q6U4_9PSED|nr:hypothetical protein [Pseudomonas duriflava]TWI52457.1 hypothetical protein IQ22_03226 [Pseudomonas duriflava]
MALHASDLSAQQEIDSLLDHLQAANEMIEEALSLIVQVQRGEKSPEALKPLRDAFSMALSLNPSQAAFARH